MTEQQNQHACPVCSATLVKEDKLKYIDYYCKHNRDDHSYGIRYVKDELTKVKVRFREPNKDKLYIKFHYDLGHMEVWGIKNHPENVDPDVPVRITIAGTFIPDFSDVEKLKQKIKTYLIFS